MNATGARKIFAILALTLAVNALASEIPAEFQEPVHVAGQLGMTLYVMDSAASRASDRLVEDGIANPDRAIQGWLTSVDEDKRHVSVVFVGTQEAVPVALYMVDVPLMAGEMKVKTFREPVPLKGSLLNLWQARQLATKSLEARDDLCAKHYNTVVFQFAEGGKDEILVYFLPAAEKPDIDIVGGYLLYVVSREGSKILSERQFEKTCRQIALGSDQPGKRTVFRAGQTVPSEIDVYLSRAFSQPVDVVTAANKIHWRVDGPQITVVPSQK